MNRLVLEEDSIRLGSGCMILDFPFPGRHTRGTAGSACGRTEVCPTQSLHRDYRTGGLAQRQHLAPCQFGFRCTVFARFYGIAA
jgi:hypothetical protein